MLDKLVVQKNYLQGNKYYQSDEKTYLRWSAIAVVSTIIISPNI